jgi:hypothetical protein
MRTATLIEELKARGFAFTLEKRDHYVATFTDLATKEEFSAIGQNSDEAIELAAVRVFQRLKLAHTLQ